MMISHVKTGHAGRWHSLGKSKFRIVECNGVPLSMMVASVRGLIASMDRGVIAEGILAGRRTCVGYSGSVQNH